MSTQATAPTPGQRREQIAHEFVIRWTPVIGANRTQVHDDVVQVLDAYDRERFAALTQEVEALGAWSCSECGCRFAVAPNEVTAAIMKSTTIRRCSSCAALDGKQATINRLTAQLAAVRDRLTAHGFDVAEWLPPDVTS